MDEYTVGDLKKLIQSLDDDMPIGDFDHYGEFEAMTKYNFNVTSYEIQKRPKSKKYKTQKVLVINSPDFGPEPD